MCGKSVWRVSLVSVCKAVRSFRASCQNGVTIQCVMKSKVASIVELLVCEETLTSTGFSLASFSSSCSDVIEASLSARLTGNTK